MTKIKERDGVTKYIVNRRVRIPLGYDCTIMLNIFFAAHPA